MIEPRPPGVAALTGPERLLQIRVGDDRIVYEIDDQSRTIVIVRIGHRSEAFKT